MAATHTSNSPLQQQISHGRRRFLGVRQRPSGRWVAEIKVSSQNLRLWLGTFDRPEDAAMAYDRAARLLRGRTAKTNFPYEQQPSYSLFGHTPKLHRLIQHAIIKNRTRVRSSTADDQPTRNNNNHNNGFIDSVVEDTIFCCSSTNRFGSSKVYNSVFVAPSFSSTSEVEGEMVNPCKPLI